MQVENETQHPHEGHSRAHSSVGATECHINPPAPIIFKLTRKLHIPPTPLRKHARQHALSFPFTVDGGRHDRVRDHRQPPWLQTLPKGRRSSRLGLPGKLQVIAADCNPGKPHPALSPDEKFDAPREWARCRYMHTIASRRDEKVGWDPPAAAVAAGAGLKADYRVPRIT